MQRRTQAEVEAAVVQARDSASASKEQAAAMEAEVRCLAAALATAEEEAGRHAEEIALLRHAQETQCAQRAEAEERAAEELRARLDLAHKVKELEGAAAEREGVLARHEQALAQLQGDLQWTRAEGVALAQDKARLEVRRRMQGTVLPQIR